MEELRRSFGGERRGVMEEDEKDTDEALVAEAADQYDGHGMGRWWRGQMMRCRRKRKGGIQSK